MNHVPKIPINNYNNFGIGAMSEARVALALEIMQARGLINGFYVYNNDSVGTYQIYNDKGLKISKMNQGISEDKLGLDFMIHTDKGLIPLQVKAAKDTKRTRLKLPYRSEVLNVRRYIPCIDEVRFLSLEEIIQKIETLIRKDQRPLSLRLKNSISTGGSSAKHLEELIQNLLKQGYLLVMKA